MWANNSEGGMLFQIFNELLSHQKNLQEVLVLAVLWKAVHCIHVA